METTLHPFEEEIATYRAVMLTCKGGPRAPDVLAVTAVPVPETSPFPSREESVIDLPSFGHL